MYKNIEEKDEYYTKLTRKQCGFRCGIYLGIKEAVLCFVVIAEMKLGKMGNFVQRVGQRLELIVWVVRQELTQKIIARIKYYC